MLRVSLVLLISACTRSEGPADMASPDMTTKLVTLDGRIVDVSTTPPKGLEGVNVCVWPEKAVCTQTDSVGAFSFDIPDGVETSIGLEKTGYVTDVFILSTEQAPPRLNAALVKSATLDAWATTAGKTLDAQKGNIFLNASVSNTAPLKGATFTLTPVAGDGPFYYGPGGPAAMLTTASDSGVNLQFNVPVGDYDITIEATGHTCTTIFGWSTTRAMSLRMHTYAGGFTSVGFVCN